MKFKKIFSILVATIFIFGLTTACDNNKNDDTNANPTTQAEPNDVGTTAGDDTNTDETVEITWWSFPTFDDKTGKYDQALVTAFEEKNPNIKVNLEMIDFTSGPEKITTAVQGGTAPDVLFDAPGRIVDYGKDGVLASLNDLFTDDLKNDINNENIVKACSDGENYWMYPLSSAPFLMAYNKTVLEEEGLLDMINLEGDRTWTTDQFTALNKALADKGHKNAVVFCMDQGGDQGTRAFISNLYSSSITNKDLTEYTINDANGIKALDYIIQEVKDGNLTNGSSYNGSAAIEQFVSGTVTSTILWGPGLAFNNTEALKDNGIEAIALPFPSDDGKPNETEYLVNGFCVFNNGNNKKIEASKEFVKFICDDSQWGAKNVVATNCFPVRESFENLYPDNEEMAFYASLTNYYGTYYNTIDGFASMRPAWFSNLQAALTGDKDGTKALNDFVDEGNKTTKQ